MIKVTSLFSGSRGNCTLVQSGTTNILIDAGVNYKRIVKAISELQLSMEDISDVLVSHEHGDHIGAMQLLCSNNSHIVVHCHSSLGEVLREKCNNVVCYDTLFTIGDMLVTPIECSHDSLSCHGYIISDFDDCMGIATDTGYVSQDMLSQLCKCRTVLLESNHDISMLDNGKYRYSLKQRVKSDKGHLSNEQAGQVLSQLIASGNIRNIVLCHLSRDNNTPETAFDSAMRVINSCGLVEGRDISLYVANQYIRSDTIE